MRRTLSDRELKRLIHDYFCRVAYLQIAANERIREFYQINNETSIDINYLIEGLVQAINEEKQNAQIEALEYALEFVGQFPDSNLADVYEYVKDKERENIENSNE